MKRFIDIIASSAYQPSNADRTTCQSIDQIKAKLDNIVGDYAGLKLYDLSYSQELMHASKFVTQWMWVIFPSSGTFTPNANISSGMSDPIDVLAQCLDVPFEALEATPPIVAQRNPSETNWIAKLRTKAPKQIKRLLEKAAEAVQGDLDNLKVYLVNIAYDVGGATAFSGYVGRSFTYDILDSKSNLVIGGSSGSPTSGTTTGGR